MRRILQLAVSLLILLPLLWPITEFFDRWDAPGLDNDIEIALFSVLFLLCLVLLMTKLLSRLKPVRGQLSRVPAAGDGITQSILSGFTALGVVPHASPPLQI